MNSHDIHDDRLRQAVEHLPEAPPDPAFASRVMAIAAVTPQCDPVGVLAGRNGGLRPVFKAFWAVAGFSLGVAIFVSAYFSLLGAAMDNTNRTAAPSPSITQSVLVFDPLEAALADNWNGGDGGR